MKKPNTTPGDWEVITEDWDEVDIGVPVPGRIGAYQRVAQVDIENYPGNKNAILAVPDMIEALIHVAEHLEDYAETHGRDPKNVPGYPRVIEALRKAGVELEGGCHAS